MELLRLTTRLTLFAGFLALTASLAGALLLTDALFRSRIDRAPFARFCFNGASRCLGFRVSAQGAFSPRPVLYVSNHISWSDIPVLGGMVPLRFLSKAEVGRWPVIGWLAAQAGTLFIQRGSGMAGQTRREIADTLIRGQSVLVFPEGTTTAGMTVLPFHSRLLHAAADAGVDIQPVSIGYLRSGRPDHLAPFIGDDEFQHHLVRMLRQPAVEVGVIAHPVVSLSDGCDVSEITRELQKTVQQGLREIQAGRLSNRETAGPTAVAGPEV
ncbi:1-acyl-sn-glycerol-3-phosphate acyltransferase [Marinobacter panjinensis]|uniref:1-acyl-sn-glycerol-3-phosphate acyltransferase n=1 Tax=Marinobacter panjinensis TaxID=2576384 RepID=A0A4U6QVW1_9GAMM|nr:lysophospholipid acyltransferase family protein [Marinobacter panjinensis]MCR8914902.1 1-acyl-sn-glycerol-3-phosphate acyltransferase [Marinobacter panjinensis]TKV64146.1 1-acyl-sn-glycerol-3-phosphate acyltransferase [Marinobacter panjinensis]